MLLLGVAGRLGTPSGTYLRDILFTIARLELGMGQTVVEMGIEPWGWLEEDGVRSTGEIELPQICPIVFQEAVVVLEKGGLHSKGTPLPDI